MKNRPLCIATVFYIIGIVMGLYLKLSIAFFVVILALAVFILYIKFNKRKDISRAGLRIGLENELKIDLKERKSCILKFLVFVLILIIGILNVKQIDNKYEKFYQLMSEFE